MKTGWRGCTAPLNAPIKHLQNKDTSGSTTPTPTPTSTKTTKVSLPGNSDGTAGSYDGKWTVEKVTQSIPGNSDGSAGSGDATITYTVTTTENPQTYVVMLHGQTMVTGADKTNDYSDPTSITDKNVIVKPVTEASGQLKGYVIYDGNTHQVYITVKGTDAGSWKSQLNN